MGAPVDVSVNPSSATEASSYAGTTVNQGKTFNFGAPSLPGKVPMWLIAAALIGAGLYLWSKRRA